MLVEGDVQCLHCGYESGQWRGIRGHAPTWDGFRPAAGATITPDDEQAGLRCLRCHGPVMVNNLGAVMTAQRLRRIQRLREELAALNARHERRAKRRAA